MLLKIIILKYSSFFLLKNRSNGLIAFH